MASVERIAFTPEEAADASGLHYETILNAIHSGELAAKAVGKGRIYRIHRDALDEYLKPCRDRESQPARRGTPQTKSGSSTTADIASAQAAATRVMSMLLKKR